jgi:hypothetical protein
MKVLVLRTCNADMTARDGFKWPMSGPVEAPDWNGKPECGGGLHGLLWGDGDWSLLNLSPDAKWLVVEVDEADMVKIDDTKVKFSRGVVVSVGNMADAMSKTLCSKERFDLLFGDAKTQKSSGDGSTAASSGDQSRAASSGDQSTAASSGKDTIAMAVGTDCAVSAGENGCFATAYYDAKAKRNKIAVGYVGQRGIKANVTYCYDVQRKRFVEVKPVQEIPK